MSDQIFGGLTKDKIKGILLFFIFSLIICQPAFSQRKERIRETKKKFHPIEIKALNDTLIPTLVNKVASYTFTIGRDSFLLSHNYDLVPIEENLPDIEKMIKSFRAIFNRVGQQMNFQGLNTSTIILQDIAVRLSSYEATLNDYKNTLNVSNKKVQKITTDTSLFVEVSDSALKDEIDDVIYESTSLQRQQRLKLAEINLVSSRVSINLFEAKDIISDMLYLSISQKMNLFKPEKAPLFQSDKSQYIQTTKMVTAQGMVVAGKVILIYLAARINLLILSFIILGLIFIMCKRNNKRIQKRKNSDYVM
jgi:hypothetical protein